MTKENNGLTTEIWITSLLNRVGVSANVMGYHYLKQGIIMALDRETGIISMTKEIYPEVAKLFESSPSRVERAMRHAITTAWKQGAAVNYCTVLGMNNMKRPTNGQFIASVAEFIRLEQKKKAARSA